MRRFIKTLLCLTLALALSVPALADMYPKPSVHVSLENLPDGPVYGTLLSPKSGTGPYSADDVYYRGDAGGEAVFAAFREYEDADGFYFLNYIEDCSDGNYSWTYYPPDTFKLLLYFPETGEFRSSGIINAYAYDSWYTVDLAREGAIALEKSYDYGAELINFAARCVLTIALEIIIALAFGCRSRRELGFIALINAATQLSLNLAASAANYFGGVSKFVVAFVGFELLVVIFEAAVYHRELPRRGPLTPGRATAYAVTANVFSAAAGLWLAQKLPGIF